MMLFLIDVLRTKRHMITEADAVIESGELLKQLVRLIRNSLTQMNDHDIQTLTTMWCRHMRLIEHAHTYVPKHHLMFHLIDRVKWFGNPWDYAVFFDESLNKNLKGVLRT